MQIDLPVIRAGLIIGIIDLKHNKVIVNTDNPVKYSCSLSRDCCTRFAIPITDFDIQRIEKRGYAIDQITIDPSPIIKLPKSEFRSVEKNYRIKR